MGKVLLFILVAVLLYLYFVRGRRSPHAGRPAPPSDAAMIRCAHCGLHVPTEESVAEDDRHYCCEEHRRLGHG